jgi:two-component system, LytTR family, response regulator
MLRTLIVEDEPLARDQLRACIAMRDDLDLIDEATDGTTAIRLVDLLVPDLLLLDIKLPECSGVHVLRAIDHRPAVVFTTAYDSYALTAFELGAFDYLLKPFGSDRFNKAIERVLERIPHKDTDPPMEDRLRSISENNLLDRFFVRHLGRTLPVRTSDITRFEAEDDYTAIHVGGKKYLIHLSMRELERHLDPRRFLRVHRSAILNLSRIQSAVQRDRRFLIQMDDGSTVMTSRSRTHLIHGLRL